MEETWEEIYYWLRSSELPFIIGMLVLFWFFGKVMSKKKKTSPKAQNLMEKLVHAKDQASADQAIQDWSDDDEPAYDQAYSQEQAPASGAMGAPTPYLDPHAPPYKEEGVKAGWIIALAVLAVVALVVYYVFGEDVSDLMREIKKDIT